MPSSRYQVALSDDTCDQKWDEFLTRAPGGHHVQSCAWGRLKAHHQWKAIRIIAREGSKIVAGGQLLVRSLPRVPFLGRVGYLAMGPVCLPAHGEAVLPVLQRLKQLARELRIRYCAVQPSPGSAWDHRFLEQNDYRPSAIQLGPLASLRIDLAVDSDTILAAMKRRRRYNIRHGLRNGVQVRPGLKEEMPIFHQLLRSTAGRQRFNTDTVQYFHKLITELGPMATIFFAEKDGRFLSAALTISFAHTTYLKRLGWSGAQGKYHPNEVLIWEIIRWSQAHGDRFFDFEGIDLEAARQIETGRPVPSDRLESVSSFKLGFGGEVVICPQAREYFVNKGLRKLYQVAGKEKALQRLRAFLPI